MCLSLIPISFSASCLRSSSGTRSGRLFEFSLLNFAGSLHFSSSCQSNTPEIESLTFISFKWSCFEWGWLYCGLLAKQLDWRSGSRHRNVDWWGEPFSGLQSSELKSCSDGDVRRETSFGDDSLLVGIPLLVELLFTVAASSASLTGHSSFASPLISFSSSKLMENSCSFVNKRKSQFQIILISSLNWGSSGAQDR